MRIESNYSISQMGPRHRLHALMRQQVTQENDNNNYVLAVHPGMVDRLFIYLTFQQALTDGQDQQKKHTRTARLNKAPKLIL